MTYSPSLGRFLEEDPSGFAGGSANLYQYVGNNPVNFRDPMGLQAQGQDVKLLGGTEVKLKNSQFSAMIDGKKFTGTIKVLTDASYQGGDQKKLGCIHISLTAD